MGQTDGRIALIQCPACLSVPRCSCLGYRHAGCLQLSHRLFFFGGGGEEHLAAKQFLRLSRTVFRYISAVFVIVDAAVEFCREIVRLLASDGRRSMRRVLLYCCYKRLRPAVDERAPSVSIC